MKRVLLGAALAGLLVASLRAQPAPGDAAALSRFVRAQLDKSNIPGAAVVVVQGDSVVFAEAFGGQTKGGARSRPRRRF